MVKWHDEYEPIILQQTGAGNGAMSLQVEVGSGAVLVNRLTSDGETWVPIESEGILTESGIYKIDRDYSPTLKIEATGDAKFSLGEKV